MMAMRTGCWTRGTNGEPMVCPHCGTEIVQPKKARRSLAANAYYWGVVLKILGDELGYEPDEMHEAMKLKFRSRVCPSTGLTIVKSTRTGSPDFWEYVEQIRRWAATWPAGGIYIPDPNEVPAEWAA